MKLQTSFLFFTLLLLPVFLNSGCTESDRQSQLLHSDSSIEIHWEVISNFEPDSKFSAKLSLVNTGSNTFPAAGWSLYLNSIRPLDSDSFLPEFEAVHINGDFYKISPTEEFEQIGPGETREKEYLAGFHAIKKSDAPQGFYFVFDNGRIENVPEVKVAPFKRPEQFNRTEFDLVQVPNPAFTFTENEDLSLLPDEDITPVTPTPWQLTFQDGFFKLDEPLLVFHSETLQNEAGILNKMLADQYNFSSALEPGDFANTRQPGIYLMVDEQLENPEQYSLEITAGHIQITGGSESGVFYGVQSFRPLLDNKMADSQLPALTINDAPAFEYRGMHLDVARNFQSAESVKRLLDIMSMYKLNRFHFHLTDDEGWRLAIDSLPELTEIGGRRGHTENEAENLIPSYGSGPDPSPGSSFGSGWYSAEEYIDILKFATERHIEVIPEIDVPGHARAAIIAMKNRANRLQADDDREAAGHYRLDEPEDASVYQSIQFFDDNVINVCIESTYRFLETVTDEIIELHNRAEAPLTTIHVGGDEVPQGVWEESPACQNLMAQEGITNPRHLQNYFFSRFEKILSNRGLKMAGWEEVAFLENEGGHLPNPNFTETVIPHVWSNIWGSGTEEYAYELANFGYRVIMSHASNFYFDFAYNKHWKEPGFYWAAMFGTKTPYSFIPFNLYKNAEADNYGNPISEDYFLDAVQLTASGRENIYGIQGQLWTETVNETGRMDYMIFPRLLGLAERAWVGEADWSSITDRQSMFESRDIAWNEFANRLGQFELKRLDVHFSELNYRLPAPGAIVQDGVLYANSTFPGLEIRYNFGTDTPGTNSPVYNGPVEVTGEEFITLSVFNSAGRAGKSVTISVN